MNKYFLGVNTKSNRCCVIRTDGIISHFYATNWNGCDDVRRTLELEKLTLTGVKTKYDGRYNGTDDDMGHTYDFSFHFDELWEAVKVGTK